MSDITPSRDSLRSTAYLATCSKVTLDAYNRVLQQLETMKEKDRQAQELLQKRLTEQELLEKTQREKLKQEALATNQVLKMQMTLKQQREKSEKEELRDEYRTTVEKLPENVVNVYPRIVETPPELKKGRKTQFQEDTRRQLQEQIESKKRKVVEEKEKIKKAEREEMQKIMDKMKKEEELAKQKEKEKFENYRNDLSKDIESKHMQKKNQKRLEEIEIQGMNQLQHILSQGSAEGGSREKGKITDLPTVAKDTEILIQDSEAQPAPKVEPSVDHFPLPHQPNDKVQANPETYSESHFSSRASDAKADKLALILERKQRKANELLKKIENLEKGPRSGSSSPQKLHLEKMKKALNPPSYKMVSDGKLVHLSKNEVGKIIDRQAPKKADDELSRVSHLSRNRSEEKFTKSPIEKAQRIAYTRYLESLEAQANEEQKRILNTLKREHEAVDRIKEKEKKLKEQRQLYRHMILEQIAKSREQKIQTVVKNKQIPDIAGEMGYPPLYEPSPEVKKKKAILAYKKQKEALMDQMQEKQNKLRKQREKEVQMARAAETSKLSEEDVNAKMLERKKKLEEYAKYKEAWDMERQIRKLRNSIEQGLAKQVEPKQFMLPTELVEKPERTRISHTKSRAGSLTPLSDRKGGVFLTEAIEDTKSRKPSQEAGQYPWEKRERSREQYRTIIKQ